LNIIGLTIIGNIIEVDNLGDQFRPAMRTEWLAYIKKTYSADAVQHGPALGQGESNVGDDE
jgi:hypothetical protein